MSNYKTIPTLGFSDAVSLASKRLMDFSGRSRRSEFWFWMLLVIITNWVIANVLFFNVLLSTIAQILIMVLGLSVTVRRLQDTGRSAIWVYASFGLGILTNLYLVLSGILANIQLLSSNSDALARFVEKEMSTFVTVGLLYLLWVVFSIIVIVFCCMDSNIGPNDYGESPKYVLEEE